MEKWDAYDDHFRKIDGVTLIRGEAIPDGQYHLVCDILVRHRDGTYLLMQRDLRKPQGGLWEASAGGSALLGENPLECAVRELQEETGIIARDIRELGRVVHHGNKTIYVSYLCTTDWEKDGITLQPGETIAYRWAAGKELARIPQEELASQRVHLFLKF